MDPKATLKSYLSERQIKPATFASTIGYDKSNFHRLLNDDDSWPSLDLAHKIDVATGGAVSVASWAAAKAARSQSQQAA